MRPGKGQAYRQLGGHLGPNDRFELSQVGQPVLNYELFAGSSPYREPRIRAQYDPYAVLRWIQANLSTLIFKQLSVFGFCVVAEPEEHIFQIELTGVMQIRILPHVAVHILKLFGFDYRLLLVEWMHNVIAYGTQQTCSAVVCDA